MNAAQNNQIQPPQEIIDQADADKQNIQAIFANLDQQIQNIPQQPMVIQDQQAIDDAMADLAGIDLNVPNIPPHVAPQLIPANILADDNEPVVSKQPKKKDAAPAIIMRRKRKIRKNPGDKWAQRTPEEVSMAERKKRRESLKGVRKAVRTPVAKVAASGRVRPSASPRVKQLSPERRRYLKFAQKIRRKDSGLYRFLADKTKNNRYRTFSRFEEFITAAESTKFGHKSASADAILGIFKRVKATYDTSKYRVPKDLQKIIKDRLDKLQDNRLQMKDLSNSENLIPLIMCYDLVSRDKSALKGFYKSIDKKLPAKLV